MKRPINMKSLILLALTTAVSVSFAQIGEDATAVTPLGVGDEIPSVKVRGTDGMDIDLKSITALQPAVIVFYRGGWCPFCNRHLAALSDIQDELAATGFQIIGISPDRPKELTKTVEKNELGYLLFSDSKARAIQRFGLGFKVDDQTIEKYKGYNIDLEEASGEIHHILPVPAVYMVDMDGKILYRYYEPDYKVRLSPAEVLAAAKAHAPEPVQ